MAANTPNRAMPEMDPNQAQPNVPYNVALIILDAILGGTFSKNVSGVSAYSPTPTEQQNLLVDCFNGTVVTTLTYTQSGLWVVFNESNFALIFKSAGATTATVAPGELAIVMSNGTAFWLVGQGNDFINTNADYQVPTTGFSITISAGKRSLTLDPAGTLATGTITMPAAPVDGQKVAVSTTQTITALTTSANAGQSIKNAPTTLAAGAGFQYQYRASNTTWYRLY